MILILNILNKNKATWLLHDQTIKYSHDFVMPIGQDTSLVELDKLFKKAKVSLVDVEGLILAVKESSLTQLRVLTTVMNTLGWQLNKPLTAKFYYQGNFDQQLPKLLKAVKKNKKFTAVNIEYQRQPDITISQKPAKYSLSK